MLPNHVLQAARIGAEDVVHILAWVTSRFEEEDLAEVVHVLHHVGTLEEGGCAVGGKWRDPREYDSGGFSCAKIDGAMRASKVIVSKLRTLPAITRRRTLAYLHNGSLLI